MQKLNAILHAKNQKTRSPGRCKLLQSSLGPCWIKLPPRMERFQGKLHETVPESHNERLPHWNWSIILGFQHPIRAIHEPPHTRFLNFLGYLKKRGPFRQAPCAPSCLDTKSAMTFMSSGGASRRGHQSREQTALCPRLVYPSRMNSHPKSSETLKLSETKLNV